MGKIPIGDLVAYMVYAEEEKELPDAYLEKKGSEKVIIAESAIELHNLTKQMLEQNLPIEEHVRNLIRIHIEYASSYPELTGIFLSEMSAGWMSRCRSGCLV